MKVILVIYILYTCYIIYMQYIIYIYIYIYIIYIIYIYCIIYIYIYIYDIWRHFSTDDNFFRSCAEMKNNSSERNVCITWLQLRSWFKSCGAKVLSFIILNFSRCFSISLNDTFDAVCMLLSCSMIMSFPWLLKSC